MPSGLAVVAHHDDHILWMGGTIQRLQAAGWEWTLIAMCVPEPDKQRYYRDCCEALKVSGHSMDFMDYMGPTVFGRNNRESMRGRLLEVTREKVFDFAFTHWPEEDGEYGKHANHLEVAHVVASLAAEGVLGVGTSNIAYFSYQAIYGGGGRPTVARTDADWYLRLTYDELRRKCTWCANVPDLVNLINLGYACPNPEAFSGNGLKLPQTVEAGLFIPGDRPRGLVRLAC